MSYPPDPNNPYNQPQQPQQPPQAGYGYPQQAPPAAGYGYPQQPPQQPAYGVPQQQAYAYAPAPGTLQANNGYISIAQLGTVKLATMGQRFLARLIDGLAIGAVIALVMALGLASALGIAKEADDCSTYRYGSASYNDCLQQNQDAAAGFLATMMIMIGVLSVFNLLYEWLMVSFAGATLGKLALGLRVVKENTGQVPGLGGGFIRFIIPIVGAFLCYIGAVLVYLSPFFDNSGKLQGWHDRAAGTLVIKK
ncbi:MULTISPECIES: RDD family protein [unclassified Streptomyces]|uniref:RDD family protein n=1 Tax=Streptomycetaceae TaxID=2062 RepID=UPI002E76392F|nr:MULTISPECIES: RDD family protein [unclassified Streptomyces]MED7947811.1 RDD family protein [Streptomyces sp. BE303]MEE1828816.1 RDD family protein [Streptomyces sp. BE20]